MDSKDRELDQIIRELSLRIKTLESQVTLLSNRTSNNTKRQKRADAIQNRKLARLEKILICMGASFTVWSIVGNRVRDVELSDENISSIIQVVGYIVTGSVGGLALSQNHKQTKREEEEELDDISQESACYQKIE